MSGLKKSRNHSIPSINDLQVNYTNLPLSSLKMPESLYAPSSGRLDSNNLILPIIVHRTEGDKAYTILDGCKRFRSFRQRRLKAITCAVISSPMPEHAYGFLRIKFNLGRSFHFREKLLFLNWLCKECNEEEKKAVLADLKMTEYDMETLAPLFSGRKNVVDAVGSGILHPTVLKTFLLLSRIDQDTFLETFREARLSFQTQREFLEWLSESAFMKDTTVSSILNQPEIRTVVDSPALNWPQKIEKIRNSLHNRRYPRLSSAQKQWNRISSAVNPDPSAIKFIPSPFFEKNRLEVRCILTHPENAGEIFGKLAVIPESTWKTLIYPLS